MTSTPPPNTTEANSNSSTTSSQMINHQGPSSGDKAAAAAAADCKRNADTKMETTVAVAKEYHRSHSHSGEKRPYDPFKDSNARYLGYVNEFGEAFRQVIPQSLVTGTYLVAGVYGLGDAIHKAYLAKEQPTQTQQIQGSGFSMFRAFTETAIFQCLASVFVPPYFVHLAVALGKKMVKKRGIAPASLQYKYFPILMGLSMIPLLPFTLDPVVEYAMDATVHAGFNKWEIERIKKMDLEVPSSILRDLEKIEEEKQLFLQQLSQDAKTDEL